MISTGFYKTSLRASRQDFKSHSNLLTKCALLLPHGAQVSAWLVTTWTWTLRRKRKSNGGL